MAWTKGALELLRDSGLLQDSVRSVPGEDFVIYGKAAASDRAVPDFVISASGPFVMASVGAENLFHLRRVAGHLGRQDRNARFFVLVTYDEFNRPGPAFNDAV